MDSDFLGRGVVSVAAAGTGWSGWFVDDLDRCAPENCIMVLEAMKLFFDLEGCVFVLGIDREVVQKGIEHKYEKRSKPHILLAYLWSSPEFA